MADLADNAVSNVPFTGGQSYTIDKTAPTLTMSSTAADPTNTSPIAVTVTFSEPVTGFTVSDIVVSSATVSNFSGAGASYSFNLIPLRQGLVTVDIAAGVCTDAAGNTNTAAAQFSRVCDTVRPYLIGVVAPDAGTLVVTFNKPVRNADRKLNYTCTCGLGIRDALRLTDMQYRFYTDNQVTGTSYTLSVRNTVTDRAGNPIDATRCSRSFTGGRLTAVESWRLYR